jgi:hypothetical protein
MTRGIRGSVNDEIGSAPTDLTRFGVWRSEISMRMAKMED